MKTLFEQPPLAHTNDPLTSFDAADKMVESGALARQERLVLVAIQDVCRALGRTDFTPKEIVKWNTRFDYHTIQRRLSGLRNKGKIERTGEKRGGCCVWKLKETENGR